MKRFLPVVVLMAVVWAGCGGKKSTPPTTPAAAVTISPTTASVAGGATQQFTATVTGSTNTAVTWQVNGTVGGDAIVGTINSTGLYTAPSTLPTSTTVGVSAVSQADTTKSATATVTLTAPAVTITISPTSATVAAGGTQQFTPTVTVTGSTNMAVNWGIVGGPNPALGTISSSGLYTAPLSPPKGSITVVATSQANTAFSASAPITVQFGNASLNGTYVFLATQADNSSGSGFAFRGGTFVADGAGNITAGQSDSNSASQPPANLSLTGTYFVGVDGRGTATFNDASGPHKFSFALTSTTRGQLIEFDSAGVTSGFIRQQNQTAIGSVSGSFIFSLFGDNSGPSAAVGQISFASTTVTGTEDVNNAGVVTQGTGVVGPFAVGPGGRGTVALNTSHFAFYIIDASTLVLINVDPSGARTAGTAYAQSTAAFSNATLGTSAYVVSGNAVPGNKAYAQAGRFDTDANGKFTGSVFDTNTAGALTTNSFAVGATYSVAANGRAQISTGTSNFFIVWLASTKQGVVMQADTTAVAAGLLFQQQTGFQSVTGGYAFTVAGADSTGARAQAIDGQVTTSGLGVLSGTEDVNLGGATQSGVSLTGNLPPLTNGRSAGTISGVGYDFYFVSPDRFILLSASSNSVLSGVAERQCSDCQF